MTVKISVLINGAFGKMGQLAVKTLEAADDFLVVGTAGKSDNLADKIRHTGADIIVDFSTADAAYAVVKTIIESGAHPVIGTSGFLAADIQALQKMAAEKKRGGVIAPNFSLGAVLMMRYAAEIARYLPAVEIIEMHHDRKMDAPSGTAIKTAELIAKNRKPFPSAVKEIEVIPHVRGGRCNSIPVHSIRLPGYVAHQQVLFSAPGEVLTLRHDMLDRQACMAGVLLACRQVKTLDKLVYGLEHLLG